MGMNLLSLLSSAGSAPKGLLSGNAGGPTNLFGIATEPDNNGQDKNGLSADAQRSFWERLTSNPDGAPGNMDRLWNGLSLLGATLTDSSAELHGRKSDALTRTMDGIENAQRKADFTRTLSALKQPPNPARPDGGGPNAPGNPARDSGLPSDFISALMNMDPERGSQMLASAILQARGDSQARADKTVTPMSDDERRAAGFRDGTVAFRDGLGKPLVAQEPDALSPEGFAQKHALEDAQHPNAAKGSHDLESLAALLRELLKRGGIAQQGATP